MESDAPPPIVNVNPPPVIAAQPPSHPPRKSRGWMIAALVLLVLLILSLVINFSQFVGNLLSLKSYSRSGGPRLDEVVIENNEAKDKIAVVELTGIITSVGTEQGYNLAEVIRAQLKRAGEDARVKAVILKVNSPGGEVLASDEIYNEIKNFQTITHKPVIASMGSLAASGGYYVSAPCRWIVANELTITGSIGVIMQTWNYRGLMDKVGLAPLVFKSGKFKDMLSGSREPNDIPAEEREMVQNLINEVFGKFKSIVAAGRTQASLANKTEGRTLDLHWQDYADGRVLSGTDALKLGFVDELGNFDVAVERTKIIAKLADANLVEYRQRRDLADLFSLFGKTEGRTLKVDIGVETPKLEAGQLYFLSPTLVH